MEPPVAHKLLAADARRVAAARAARAAASSRRAAAAQRRLLLTGILAVATLGMWVLGFATSVPVLTALIPTAATVAVVELGRRAAAAGRAADARLAAAVRQAEQTSTSAAMRAATPEPRLRVDVDPTSLIDEPAERSVVSSSEPAREWTPVPVPPPAYTLKASTPRRVSATGSAGATTESAAQQRPQPNDAETEFIPAADLGADQLERARAERDAALADPAAESGIGADRSRDSESAVVGEPATAPSERSSPAGSAADLDTSGMNVQEILARRRAVG